MDHDRLGLKVYLLHDIGNNRHQNLIPPFANDVNVVAARPEDLQDFPQFSAIIRPNGQADDLMPIVKVWGKHDSLVDGDLNILVTKGPRGCRVIDAVEFEDDRLGLKTRGLNAVRAKIIPEVNCFKLEEVIGEIGQNSGSDISRKTDRA